MLPELNRKLIARVVGVNLRKFGARRDPVIPFERQLFADPMALELMCSTSWSATPQVEMAESIVNGPLHECPVHQVMGVFLARVGQGRRPGEFHCVSIGGQKRGR